MKNHQGTVAVRLELPEATQDNRDEAAGIVRRQQLGSNPGRRIHRINQATGDFNQVELMVPGKAKGRQNLGKNKGETQS